MYCRSCGEEINDQAVICVKCGVPVFKGKEFCQQCGKPTSPEHSICMSCGVNLKNTYSGVPSGRKEWLVTLLLNIFVGYLGIHRFYTGHTGIGLVQFFTCGGCGIWTLIDFILIIIDQYKDANGNDLYK